MIMTVSCVPPGSADRAGVCKVRVRWYKAEYPLEYFNGQLFYACLLLVFQFLVFLFHVVCSSSSST